MSMNAVPSGPSEPENKHAPVAGGGGPPDGDMGHRITVLETRFDTILPTLATKADLAGLRLDLSEKMGGLSLELNEKMNGLRLELNEKMDNLHRDVSEKMDKLRVELHVALTNTMKWCVGIAMTLFVGMVGHGLYLGTQINNLAARLPPATPLAAPAVPALTVPHAQPSPSPHHGPDEQRR